MDKCTVNGFLDPLGRPAMVRMDAKRMILLSARSGGNDRGTAALSERGLEAKTFAGQHPPKHV
jgi:hypothetical protein